MSGTAETVWPKQLRAPINIEDFRAGGWVRASWRLDDESPGFIYEIWLDGPDDEPARSRLLEAYEPDDEPKQADVARKILALAAGFREKKG